MANPTVWTSSIQNVNIDQLRRELEAYPGIDPGEVLSIEPKNGPTDTTITIAVDFGMAGDTDYDNVQAIIDSHVDNQTENLNLIGRNDSIFGNKESGQITFQNNDIFVWRIDSNNDLLPVQSGLDFGNSSNRINKIWAVTGSISGDLTVDGNLTVNGTLTWVNTTNLEVSDNIILINSDWTGSPTEDAGIEVERDVEANARLNWNETDNWWEAGAVGDLQKLIRETEFQSHVTDTANPHSVTKSQVGLGNVTNNAQLTRGNGDFNTFFEKTVPVAADIFLIEDSASSFAKNKLTFANLEANLDHNNLLNTGVNSHAQIDSHISNTSNPHLVTASQVGLGNVTNAAQLLRTANDFNTFTQKVSPDDADVILIEDSADSGNKKYITLDSIAFGVQANNTYIQWENAAASPFNVIGVDASDRVVISAEDTADTIRLMVSPSGSRYIDHVFDDGTYINTTTPANWNITGNILELDCSTGSSSLILNGSTTTLNGATTTVSGTTLVRLFAGGQYQWDFTNALMAPAVDASRSIGSTTLRLNKVYALNFTMFNGDLKVGPESVHHLKLQTASIERWRIESDGDLVPQALYDIGSMTNPVDTVYANNLVGPVIGGGISWQAISGNTTADVDTGYVVIGSSGQVELALPTTSAVGDVIEISSADANGWRITQGASQRIRFASVESTIGAGGYIQATQQGDSVKLVCVVADFKWNVVSSIGNIEIV